MAEIRDYSNNPNPQTADRWPEGMAMSSVNDTGRVDEGIIGRWEKDVNTSLVTAGTSTAYTLTPNRDLVTGQASPLYDGLELGLRPHVENGENATLNVQSTGAKAIVDANDVALPAGGWPADIPQKVIYSSSLDKYIAVSALDDAASVIYTPESTNAQVRSVQSVLRETVSALDVLTEAEKTEVWSGNPTTDLFQKIRDLDDWCYANGRRIVFPPGTTWYFESGFNDIDLTQVRTSWDFRGVHFKFNLESATEPRILSVGNNTLRRPEVLSIGTPTSDLAALNNQLRPGCTVILSDPASDAAKFAAGDTVFISCGIDPYDSDAEIWGFTMQSVIVDIDAASGVITLCDALPVPLTARGWAPSSAKNTASDWANATAYSVGNYVYGGTGSSKPTALFEAVTAGTSSGTSPDDDTGVTWIRRTNDLGALRNARDGRPVIQKVPNPVNDVHVRAGIVENVSATRKCQQFGFIQTAYNSKIEGMKARGQGTNTFGFSDSQNNCRLIRCYDQTESVTIGSVVQRSLNCQAAHNAVAEDCVLSGNVDETTSEVCFVEAAGNLTLVNTTVGCASNETADARRTGVQINAGRLTVNGGRFMGFSQPVTVNNSDNNIIPDLYEYGMELLDFKPDYFEIGAKNFRRLWRQERPSSIIWMFRSQSPFTIFDTDGDIPQRTRARFSNYRVVRYLLTFDPLASQPSPGTLVSLPSALEYGYLDDAGSPAYPFHDGDSENLSMVFLGAIASWENAPAGGEVTLRFNREQGGTSRGLYDTNTTNNQVKISDAVPRIQKFEGGGTGKRLIDGTTGEKFELAYFSNASAAGGTITVVAWLLIEDSKAGLIEV